MRNEMFNKLRDEIDLETRVRVKHYTNTDDVIDDILDAIDGYKEKLESQQENIIGSLRAEIESYSKATKDEKLCNAFNACLRAIDYYTKSKDISN